MRKGFNSNKKNNKKTKLGKYMNNFQHKLRIGKVTRININDFLKRH